MSQLSTRARRRRRIEREMLERVSDVLAVTIVRRPWGVVLAGIVVVAVLSVVSNEMVR